MRGDPTSTLGILVAGLIGLEAERRVLTALEPPLGWPGVSEEETASEQHALLGLLQASWEFS